MALEIPGCPNNLHKFARTMTQGEGRKTPRVKGPMWEPHLNEHAGSCMAPINTAVGSPHQVTGLGS